MRATSWEFRNRSLIFGMIFGVAYPLYFLDPRNSAYAAADWLAARLPVDSEFLVHLLLGLAAVLLVKAAFIRTWSSAYLHAKVVYAAQVKTASLVADGPYRRVRNPLYFANQVLALGMAAMMSRSGFVLAVAATLVFCYRLIFREEAELRASQGEKYENYCKAVPRLWPSPWPLIASAGRQPRWGDGFRAETWCWGFAVSVAVFAVTLNSRAFLAILAASLVWLFVSSAISQKKSGPPVAQLPER